MTNKEMLEKFGQDYIDTCYNKTMEMFSWYLQESHPGEISFSESDMKKMYATAVEQCIADFLFLFDQKRDEYSVVIHDEGKDLDLVVESDGIVGELYGDEGWLAKYSQDH